LTFAKVSGSPDFIRPPAFGRKYAAENLVYDYKCSRIERKVAKAEFEKAYQK